MAVARLEAAGIDYMITGSFALAVYATPRMTRDIGVVIHCSAEQAARLVKSFQEDSYASEDAARDAVTSGTMFNVIHNETLLKVDFIVPTRDVFQREQFARRRRIELGGFLACFISPEDLILAKLLWRRASGSDQQLRDVASLVASVPNLDRQHLATWAARLGVATDPEKVSRA